MGIWGALKFLLTNWRLALLLAAAFLFGIARLRSARLESEIDRVRTERDRLSKYKNTRKEIDNAPHGDDPDLGRRWLRERGEADRP